MRNECIELDLDVISCRDAMAAEVIQSWHVSRPIVVELRAGEIVRIGRRNEQWAAWMWCTGSSGKGCWVPENYLTAHDDGLTGWLTRDYCSAELEIEAGEWLSLHLEEGGWWFACNASGASGWVPASHIRTA